MRFSDLLSPFRSGIFILRHGFSRNWYWSFYSTAARKSWDWVLGEIEYALRFEYDNEKLDYVEIDNPDYGKTKYDRATSGANMRRAQRGFELMGKYWMNLWD